MMKRIIICLFLFFNLFPFFEKGKLTISGPLSCMAQSNGEEGGSSGSPCDIYSPYYDPAACDGYSGYDPDDPCDIYSPYNDPTACSESEDQCDPSSPNYSDTACELATCDTNSVNYDVDECDGQICDVTSVNSDPTECEIENCDEDNVNYNETKCDAYTCDKNSPNYEPFVCLEWNTCLTLDALENIFPNAPSYVLTEVLARISKYAADFGIDTPEKMQHFLAQTGAETEFAKLGSIEDLYYTTPLALHNAWSTRFPTLDYNSPYLRNPVALANYVYSSRNGNGNASTGDGYKYRGRGLIHLTGKKNYQDFQNFINNLYPQQIDIMSNPDLVIKDPDLAVESALWFFQTKVLDRMTIDANTPADPVSKIVNGGDKNGKITRRNTLTAAKENLNCN